MACLSACGEEEAKSGPISDEQAVQIGTTIVDQMNTIVSQGAIEQYVDQPALYNSFQGWQSALDDIGTYEGVSGGSVAFDEDEVAITVNVLGSSHNADVVIVLDNALATYIGITTNVHYSTGEIMAKAGMNTVIGMGTVFVVLILISLIISCFSLISKLEGKQKKEEPAQPLPHPLWWSRLLPRRSFPTIRSLWRLSLRRLQLTRVLHPRTGSW